MKSENERAEKLFELLGEIDEQMIEEAEDVPKLATKITPLPSRKSRQKLGVLVASIAFVTISIIGISRHFNLESNDDWALDMAAESPVLEGNRIEEELELAENDANQDDDANYFRELTLEEAYLIPVLGHYLPRVIPEDFQTNEVRKYIIQEEKLSASIMSDGAHIDWLIRVDNSTSNENETLLLSEITFERFMQIVQYVEADSEYNSSGENESSLNRNIETGWHIAINLIDEDVFIQINMRGVDPNEAWEMIQSIKN